MSAVVNNQDTVTNILLTAAAHFAAKGFEGARVDEIAADAKVNKATIYYHIGGKAELYGAVFTDIMGQIADDLDKNIAIEETAEAKVRAYVSTIAINVGHYPFAAPMMMREIASGAERMPEEGFRIMGRIIGSLFKILQQGEADGTFRHTDPAMTHILIIGSIMFYIAGQPVRRRLSEVSEELEFCELEDGHELAEEVSDIVLRSLRP